MDLWEAGKEGWREEGEGGMERGEGRRDGERRGKREERGGKGLSKAVVGNKCCFNFCCAVSTHNTHRC